MTINRTTENGHIRFTFDGSNHTFYMPALEGIELEPRGSFENGLNSFAALLTDQRKILEDDSLSSVGLERQLSPVQGSAVTAMAASWHSVDRYEQGLNVREQILLAVPQVAESNTASAIADREIRDWWRGLSVEDRAKYITSFNESPEHQRIEIALLRSPIAMVDWEIKAVRESWNRGRRLENVGEAAAIELGRASVEWARRGLAQLAGLTMVATKWDGERVLRNLLGSTNEFAQKGYAAFGLSDSEAKQMQMRLQSAAIMRAA
jgi:hypothetical protein